MLRDRASRTALALALLVHVLVVAPVWGGLDLIPGATKQAPAKEPPLSFQFVEAPEAPEEAPEEPTPLLSSRDQRAAQPDAPDRPEGEAYQEGRTPIPQPARPMGGGSGGAAAMTSARLGAPSERDRGEQNQADRTEAELAKTEPAKAAPPRQPTEGGPVRPGIGSVLGEGTAAGDRLPAPETDQRATRARAGSTYSLNTTAWEFGPYMERLKARIEEHVFPPPAFYYGTAAWATRVRFRIAPDGRLESLELLDHRGVQNLQHVALSAIEGAADFEPLPLDFPEPYLEITGSFYFNTSPTGR
jgi:hypothetical protein